MARTEPSASLGVAAKARRKCAYLLVLALRRNAGSGVQRRAGRSVSGRESCSYGRPRAAPLGVGAAQGAGRAVPGVRGLGAVQPVVGGFHGSGIVQPGRREPAVNLAEGSGRAGRDRLYHFRVALGSAQEAKSQLGLVVGLGLVDEDQGRAALALLDRTCALVWRLVHGRR